MEPHRKRFRDDDDNEEGVDSSPQQFSGAGSRPPLSAEAQAEKLARRKVERDGKKERERTLAYFTSAVKLLEDSSFDQSMVQGATDALLSEVIKRLRGEHAASSSGATPSFRGSHHSGTSHDDATFMFRNRMVCRAVELGLLRSSESHFASVKSLCMAMLGKIAFFATSPTASYILEALLKTFARQIGLLTESTRWECPDHRSDEDEATSTDGGENDDEELGSLVAAAVDDGYDNKQSEMLEGRLGLHPTSGIPNSFALLSSIVEELVESTELVDRLVTDAVGSKVLRIALSVFAGLRPTPPKPTQSSTSSEGHSAGVMSPDAEQLRTSLLSTVVPVAFPKLLDRLVGVISESIERVYFPEHDQRARRGDAWYTACVTPVSSLLIQSLFRCCSGIGMSTEAKRNFLEKMFRFTVRREGAVDGKVPLLVALLTDKVGAFVVQAAASVPPSKHLRLNVVPAAIQNAAVGVASAAEKGAPELQLTDISSSEDTAIDGKLWMTAWDRVVELLLPQLDTVTSFLLSSSSPDAGAEIGRAAEQQTAAADATRILSYVLQDVAMYAPTALHLAKFWTVVLQPRLSLFFSVPAMAAVLLRFTRKLSFHPATLRTNSKSGSSRRKSKKARGTTAEDEQGNNNKDDEDDDDAGAEFAAARQNQYRNLTEPQTNAQVLYDMVHHGALYFATTTAFRKEIVQALVAAAKAPGSAGLGTDEALAGPKGLMQALLVDRKLGDSIGVEIISNLLHCGPIASAMLMNQVEKLRTEDLVQRIAKHPQGTFVLQQFARNCSQMTTTTTSTTTGPVVAPQTASSKSNTKPVVAAADAKANNQIARMFSHLEKKKGFTAASPAMPLPPKNAALSSSARSSNNNHNNSAAQPPASAPTAAPETFPMLRRLVRRLMPQYTSELCQDMHGSFLIQVLYDVAPVDLKLQMVQSIAPLYLRVAKGEAAAAAYLRQKKSNAAAAAKGTEAEAEESGGEVLHIKPQQQQGSLYLMKVSEHCYVESFLHRPDEWKAAREKEAHVQMLMRRILALEA